MKIIVDRADLVEAIHVFVDESVLVATLEEKAAGRKILRERAAQRLNDVLTHAEVVKEEEADDGGK